MKNLITARSPSYFLKHPTNYSNVQYNTRSLRPANVYTSLAHRYRVVDEAHGVLQTDPLWRKQGPARSLDPLKPELHRSVKDTDVSFIMTRNERQKRKRWIGTCRGRERHEIPAIHDVSY